MEIIVNEIVLKNKKLEYQSRKIYSCGKERSKCMTNKNFEKGIAFCLLATMSWGGMFPVMTSALQHIDTYTFTCMRYAIAGALFYLVLCCQEPNRIPLDTASLLKAWFFGTCGFAGYQFLVFEGQRLAGAEGALTASIMMATMPLQAFLFNWIVRRKTPKLFVLFFILLSFSGVLLVITRGDFASLVKHPQDFGPQILIILGALCWVIYTAGASYLPDLSPVRYTTITTALGLGSAVVITAGLLGSSVVPVPSGIEVIHTIPHLIYMSLVAGFIGVLAWNIGNKILTPLNGTLFMDVVPITAFTVSAITGKVPHPVQIGGAAITIFSLICNNYFIRRETLRKASTENLPDNISTTTNMSKVN